MWVLLKDFLLVSMGMGIGVVLMCILNVGKEATNDFFSLTHNRTPQSLRLNALCVDMKS